jgi:L-alanine-DL-glutamate epimerase-like enolase superfamily enzyme
MSAPWFDAISVQVAIENFPLREPFTITGSTMWDTDVVVVTLGKDGQLGRGEASGVSYHVGDDAPGMLRRIEAVRGELEAGLDRDALQGLLPAGGARNAVDCALWDLEAKLTGRPAWQIAGLDPPRPLLTTFTVGANAAAKMAADARAYIQAKAIKMKLTGGTDDAERVRAVRAARPEVWLGVDANQGLDRDSLARLMPVLVEARVQLIEQPFPIGKEAWMDGLDHGIPFAADESVQDRADLRGLVGRFDVVNIKLDKGGGLSEGLAMAREARRLGLEVMVGNMIGSSLAMAPACLVGQLCSVVDLDGPVFLERDRPFPVSYVDGKVSFPDALWGGA